MDETIYGTPAETSVDQFVAAVEFVGAIVTFMKLGQWLQIGGKTVQGETVLEVGNNCHKWIRCIRLLIMLSKQREKKKKNNDTYFS